jgi:nucleoside-diphosphate-sugar epimerase
LTPDRGQLLAQDLRALDGLLPDARRELTSSRLFITGATGFIGKWLLESLLYFSQESGITLEVVALSRDAGRFRRTHPRLAALSGLTFVEGDIRSFAFPEGRFDLVIHGAAEASAALNAAAPLEMLDTITLGSRRVLDFCVASSARKVLLLSSGAVYGRQPPELQRLKESFAGGPDPLAPGSAYAEGKRVAEFLGAQYEAQGVFEFKIARCFAFVGPYLPLDVHFAVGNFIGDVLASRRIRVLGDGRTVRSYLYASDLAFWLWRILFDGQSGRAYNVGSEDCIDIGTLANLVADVAGMPGDVEVVGSSSPGAVVHRYVPSTDRARTELALGVTVPLDEAIRKTIRWHRAEGA